MIKRRFRRKIRIETHSAADKRPKIIKTVLISLAVIAAVVTLSVLLGNHLKKRADRIDKDNSGKAAENFRQDTLPDITAEKQQVRFDPLKVPVIKADYTLLSSSAGIDWVHKAQELKSKNITAVSLILFYGDGNVNYSSETARQMKQQSENSGKTDLPHAIDTLGQAGIYASGCFYSEFMSKILPAASNAAMAYEAALICEAADSGFPEINVFGFGCAETEWMSAKDLFDTVRRYAVTDVKLGVALPGAIFELNECRILLNSYAASADFLSVDLSSVNDCGELGKILNRYDKIIKDYNLRIIVSSKLAGAEKTLEDAGCKNWQKVPD